MNKLYIDPKHEPELLANYGQQWMHRKAPDAYNNTQVLLDALRNPETIPTSMIGRVPNGLCDARGFIVTETTAFAAQHQAFDEDALDTWNRQRGVIQRLAERRREIASTPLESAAPDQFVTTAQRTHVDLLPAVGMDTALDTLFRDIQGRGKSSKECKIDNPAVAVGIAAPMGSWRSAEGSFRVQSHKGAPEYALEYQEREAAIKDTDVLRSRLQDERQRGVEFSRNGTMGRIDDFPIPVARKGPGFVIDVKGTSTTYGDFDTSFYKNPELFPESTTTPDEEEAIRQHRTRRVMRATGIFATTHSESFQDRSDDADTDATHRRSHYFERKNATMQMPKRGNEPLLKSTNTQRGIEVASVLPNAYTTTTMAMNQHFRKY